MPDGIRDEQVELPPRFQCWMLPDRHWLGLCRRTHGTATRQRFASPSALGTVRLNTILIPSPSQTGVPRRHAVTTLVESSSPLLSGHVTVHAAPGVCRCSIDRADACVYVPARFPLMCWIERMEIAYTRCSGKAEDDLFNFWKTLLTLRDPQ